jgi:hypothetical protein
MNWQGFGPVRTDRLLQHVSCLAVLTVLSSIVHHCFKPEMDFESRPDHSWGCELSSETNLKSKVEFSFP